MRFFIMYIFLLCIFQETLGVWKFWNLENLGLLWKRKNEIRDIGFSGYFESVTGRVFVTLFGYPSNCERKGIPHSCTLSVACWWVGGSSQSGCGTTPWLVACCVTKKSQYQGSLEQNTDLEYKEDDINSQLETRENIVSQSIQRRNDILDDFDETCGISNDRIIQKRIVGGKEADFGQFPWQVYIKISSYQCGGVIVSRKFVATAAHCILTAKLTDVLVYLGELDTQDTGKVEELAPAELHRVKRRIIHPKFRYKATQPDRYDLGLLELITEAGYNFHISPICLPEESVLLAGRTAVVAGWGKVNPLNKLMGTNVLRSVTVPILDADVFFYINDPDSKEKPREKLVIWQNPRPSSTRFCRPMRIQFKHETTGIDIRECMAWHKIKQITVELHLEMMCAGHKNGKHDACLGDSGGPLIILEKGRWTLVGITSAGFGCGEANQPGIYHKVPMTVDWIKSVVSHNHGNSGV